MSIAITVDGTEHTLNPGDLTAIDARDFRAHVGLPLMGALRSLDFDLDRLAGFLWLIRRRTEKGLTFDAVARSLTYDNEIVVDLDPAGRPAVAEAGDPEG